MVQDLDGEDATYHLRGRRVVVIQKSPIFGVPPSRNPKLPGGVSLIERTHNLSMLNNIVVYEKLVNASFYHPRAYICLERFPDICQNSL